MLEELKKQVYEAKYAFAEASAGDIYLGNVNGIDREKGLLSSNQAVSITTG